jgi:hypothetical protein
VPGFPGRYRMHAGIPTLGPAYMQAPGGEVDVVPSQSHQLRGSKAMAVGDQDGTAGAIQHLSFDDPGKRAGAVEQREPDYVLAEIWNTSDGE